MRFWRVGGAAPLPGRTCGCLPPSPSGRHFFRSPSSLSTTLELRGIPPPQAHGRRYILLAPTPPPIQCEEVRGRGLWGRRDTQSEDCEARSGLARRVREDAANWSRVSGLLRRGRSGGEQLRGPSVGLQKTSVSGAAIDAVTAG